MGLDKDNKGRFKVKYDKSHCITLHKLLSEKRITKSHLCFVLQVSQVSSVTRLINQPYLLSIQQVINLSFVLEVSFSELCNVIALDLKFCANSFDTDLLLFVPPHIRELTKSNEWFER
jgi:hypothetical protein